MPKQKTERLVQRPRPARGKNRYITRHKTPRFDGWHLRYGQRTRGAVSMYFGRETWGGIRAALDEARLQRDYLESTKPLPILKLKPGTITFRYAYERLRTGKWKKYREAVASITVAPNKVAKTKTRVHGDRGAAVARLEVWLKKKRKLQKRNYEQGQTRN